MLPKIPRIALYPVFHAEFHVKAICGADLRKDGIDDPVLLILRIFPPLDEGNAPLKEIKVPDWVMKKTIKRKQKPCGSGTTEPIHTLFNPPTNSVEESEHCVYASTMHVCVLIPVLDAFKGGNHLPLFAACKDVRFTILTNHTKPQHPELPENVTVETLHMHLGPYYYGCADWRFARAVLKKYPPNHDFWKQFDVIHINQTMGPALTKLKKTGRPLLFLIHHPVSVDRAVALKESSSWIKKIHWHLKYALLVRFQRRLCRSGVTLATVSRTVANRLAKDYGCGTSLITIIPNGVDGNLFKPGDEATTAFGVIAVGSFLHPRKGFSYLSKIYQALSNDGCRIADVGRRSEAEQKELEMIRGIKNFGMIGQEELITLMQQSSVLLSTSLYEGFGLSLIEALACGRPAFAFAGGAVEEVLCPVDKNLVVPLRDTEEMLRHVRTFLALPEAERRKRGMQYRQTVLERYPLQGSATALQKLYEELCRS